MNWAKSIVAGCVACAAMACAADAHRFLYSDFMNRKVVYVDESIFAAELNAQRELIKLKLLQLFGEQVEQFEIHVSRGNYKDYHPYADEHAPEGDSDLPLAPLSEEEREAVEATARMVDDERVRKALEKAMSADLARKKAENGIGS